ncbi:MAG TPA: hypothetical protein VF173_18265 [Thermoanaerobaculia bacterium]|nr:hypothetical protein [Thermoanaerobaculia bacterium]
MKKLLRKLTLHRETLLALDEDPALKNAVGGLCTKVGTSCGSCVRACSFTCPTFLC